MGLGEGRGREPSTHCPRTWGTLCAHRGGSHTHKCGSPRKVTPRLLANFASCLSPTAQGMESGSCHGKCHGKTWPLRPGLRAVGGAGKMELMRTSWFGGWCEGAGREGARAHTLTRARTVVHTRAHKRVREPTPSGPGTPKLFPTSGDGTRRLGRGPGGSYRGSSAAVAFPSAAGPSLPRARVGRAGCLSSGATGCGAGAATLSLGRLAVGAARGGWGRGRLTGGARGGGAQGPRVPGLPGGAGAHSWTRPRAPRACLVGFGAPG